MALSKLGAVLALLYVAFAVFVVISERTGPTGGNWITLSGIASYLVTLPVSAPAELLGAKLDYKKNIDMGLAIAVCAALVYLVGAGVGWVLRHLLARPS